jgi:16S rRNA (guanine966-N2)-methyltransferase
MRIISGNLRGSKLYLTENKNTRPLKDLVRESIFNLLIHSKKFFFRLEESNILDLYSGTGSFGLECLSREAKSVYFVENDKNAFNALKKNIEKLKLKTKTKIFFSSVFNLIEKQNFLHTKFDLIFCDPPFKDANIEKLIELIFDKKILDKSGIIILHRNKDTKEKLPNFFKVLDEKIYGVSKIIFGKILS